MNNPIDALAARLVPALIRSRGLILSIALAASLTGGFFSVRLYSDLRSGLEELLPESAPSVIAARSLAPQLHASARLAVGLEGDDPAALELFADHLAARLRALPAGLIDAVEYRTDEQDAFANRFGPLLVPAADLRALRDQLRAGLGHANPLAISLDDDAEPGDGAEQKPLDLPALRAAQARLQPARFRNGYYQSEDGRLLVLNVIPAAASTGLGPNQRLLAAVREQVAALRPAASDPAPRVGYSGEVAELVEQQAALVADLASSTVIVLVLVLLALWLYFRRWGAIAAIAGALAAGCAVTFGLAWPLLGHLNANTAFLGSIVIGNGINVGIIFVARYLERRRAGVAVEAALLEAWRTTLAPTFVAAFASGLAYLSLAATGFRGFSQFGLVGALGMALCWLTAFLLLPPLLSAIESRFPIAPHASARRLFDGLAPLVERRPGAWLACAALLLAGSAAAVGRWRGSVLETDLARLGSRASLEDGALHWAAKANLVFQVSRSPIVLHASSAAELDRLLASLDERRRSLGSQDPLGQVVSLAALVPPDQRDRLALLGELRGLLGDAVLARLDPALRERARALRDGPAPRAVTFEDLPAPLRRALAERDGTVGRTALVFPRKVGRLDLDELEQIKALVRGAAAPSSGGQALSTLLLLSDIDDAIARDAPRVTLLALGLVCLLVLVVLRSGRAAATVIGTLLVGVGLLVGAAALARVRVNFLNFVVLPITFGIGVDYAVNIVQRFRQERLQPGALARILRETGGAVALCSATTVIGYASLAVADSQALAGFGLLAALGEVTCLFAALFVLPAWLWRTGRAPRTSRAAAVLVRTDTPAFARE